MNQTKMRPSEKITAGQVHAAVWRNVVKVEGQERASYRVSLERRFQKDGEWTSVNSYGLNDMLRLRYVVDKAIAFMLENPPQSRDGEENE
jgi:hypothetical protein